MNNIQKREFSQSEIELIKSQVAVGCTNSELELFLYHCNKTQLDPLAKQIYAIRRVSNGSSKMTIQASIDGLRLVAQRSALYAGQDETIFGKDIDFTYKVDKYKNDTNTIRVPETAKVTVYKFSPTGVRYPAAVGVAYWNEYIPQAGYTFWVKMPHVMLSKVAEALALRKAFPQDLSGIYITEEMEQSEKVEYPDEEELDILRKMVYGIPEEMRQSALYTISKIKDYTEYQRVQLKLEAEQIPFEQIPYPNQTDINKELKKGVQAKQ